MTRVRPTVPSKEVANPSLVILQVLVIGQRDRYEVAHGWSIGSPSDSGRTHYLADYDQISIMLVEQKDLRPVRGRLETCAQPSMTLSPRHSGTPLANYARPQLLNRWRERSLRIRRSAA